MQWVACINYTSTICPVNLVCTTVALVGASQNVLGKFLRFFKFDIIEAHFFLFSPVAQGVERPFKRPVLAQFYWVEFESRPRHKVVGKNSIIAICEANADISLGIRKKIIIKKAFYVSLFSNLFQFFF